MDLKIPKVISVVRRSVVYNDGAYVFGQEVDGDNQKLKRYTDKIERFKRNCGGKSFIDVVDFENVPTSGYRLYTHQSTYKIETVQLLSPLGFVTNISVANLFDLISSSVINNSKIEDELFYDDKMNLISVNSVGYQTLIKNAKKDNDIKETAAEVEVGDILVTREVSSNVPIVKYVYCGKYHVMSAKNRFSFSMKTASELMHVLKNMDTDQYIVTRDIKTGTYDVSPAGKKIDRQTVIDECNEQLRDLTCTFCDSTYFNHSYSVPLLFGDKKFKKEQTKYVFEDVTLDVALEGSSKYGKRYTYNLSGLDRFVVVSNDNWETTQCPLFVGKANSNYRSGWGYGSQQYHWSSSSDDADLLITLDCSLNDNGHLVTYNDLHETYKDGWRCSYEFERSKSVHEWKMKPYVAEENKNYLHLVGMKDLQYKIGFLKLKEGK